MSHLRNTFTHKAEGSPTGVGPKLGERHRRGFGRKLALIFAVFGIWLLMSQCDMLPLVSLISVRVTGYGAPGLWSAPEQLTNGSDCAWPHVGVSNSTPLAVWIDGGIVRYSQRTNNQWQNANDLSYDTGFSSLDADYTSDTVAATWTNLDGRVSYGIYDSVAGNWTTGSVTGTYSPAEKPTIAIIEHLVAYIAWESPADGNVYWAKADSNSTAVTFVGQVAGADPHIEVNTSASPARGLIVYEDAALNALRSISATSPSWDFSSGASSPETIQSGESIPLFDLDFPEFSSSSFATAVWLQQRTDGTFSVNSARMAFDASSWGSPEELGTGDKAEDIPPHAAGKDNGDCMAVWETQSGPNSSLHTGGAWRKETTNMSHGSNVATVVDARRSGGYYYITSGSDGEIFANVFNGDSGWGDESNISSNGRQWYQSNSNPAACIPSLAVVDSDGHVVAIWANNNGGISASYYSPK